MANFAMICAADKNSPMFKTFMSYVSDSLFKMLAWAKKPNTERNEPGVTEADRVRGHMTLLGMSDEQIRRAPRKYWRRNARYSCPEPEIEIRGLFDVFMFFREIDDPSRAGHSFYINEADAIAIFVKEIGYVQKGELSDMPEINYYFQVRIIWRTGFVVFRGKRSNSALEGYHLHLRASQHPCAKGQTGPRLELARVELFDFAWNVKAAVAANQMPQNHHFHLWLVDALFDVCKGAFEGVDAPPALRGQVRLDTTLQPITWRGIHEEGLKELKAQGAQALELSSLRSPADVRKVLQHPLLVVRHDAAALARETGILTSEKSLAAFKERMIAQAAARQVLQAHGEMALRGRLRVTDGGVAPNGREPAPQPPATRLTLAGPLPVAADAMRGGGNVTLAAAPPLPTVTPAMRAAQQQGQQQQGQQQQGQQQQPLPSLDEPVPAKYGPKARWTWQRIQGIYKVTDQAAKEWITAREDQQQKKRDVRKRNRAEMAED